jgi:hypothetical protein
MRADRAPSVGASAAADLPDGHGARLGLSA